jgi:hypothetical protein
MVRACTASTCADASVLVTRPLTSPPAATEGLGGLAATEDSFSAALAGKPGPEIYTCLVSACADAGSLKVVDLPRAVTYAAPTGGGPTLLFWAQGSQIFRCPGLTEPCEQTPFREVGLNDTLVGSPRSIAANGEHVFWFNPPTKRLEYCPLSGCTNPNDAQVVTSASRPPVAVAANDTHVYWVGHEPNTVRTGFVERCELPPSRCTKPTTMAAGLGELVAVALDGTHVYWVDHGFGLDRGGKVQRMPR